MLVEPNLPYEGCEPIGYAGRRAIHGPHGALNSQVHAGSRWAKSSTCPPTARMFLKRISAVRSASDPRPIPSHRGGDSSNALAPMRLHDGAAWPSDPEPRRIGHRPNDGTHQARRKRLLAEPGDAPR